MRYLPLTLLLLLCSVAAAPAHGDEEEQEPHGVKCGFPEIMHQLKNGVAIQSTRPEAMQYTFRTASGQFIIHYDRTGPHAVPAEDGNSNGIPDFVDSAAVYFDLSYSTEITEIGYLPPPADMNQSGTEEYDIYLRDVGQESGTYGYTYPDPIRIGNGGTSGRYTTYIVVDNDFSANDRYSNRRVFYETGYRALKVTAAHEFHHAVQIGGYGRNDSFSIFHEMSSTWMEFRVFPEVQDYRQYLPRLFGNLAEHNFGVAGDASSGYDYGAPLGQFMYKSFGDEFLRSVWEGILQLKNPYVSLADAYANRSSSFSEEWCRLATWFYYTGYRAQGDTYFTSASEYPAVSFGVVKNFSEPSAMFSGTLQPLEFRFARIVLPGSGEATNDTVDIGMANINIGAAAARSPAPSLYEVTCSRSPGGMEIPGTPYFLTLHNDDGQICFTAPVVNNGFIISAGKPFPNPCSPQADGSIFFPVPENAGANAKITLTVFDAAMLPVFAATSPYKVVDRARVVEWDCHTANGSTVADGVYIFTTECQGKVNAGKVVIINK